MMYGYIDDYFLFIIFLSKLVFVVLYLLVMSKLEEVVGILLML